MRIFCFLLLNLTLLSGAAIGEDSWTRFRGPNGTGLAPPLNIPSEWTAGDYAWTADLPGTGHSSPVAWGNLVCITAVQGDELLICGIELQTGDSRWTSKFPSPRGQMHAHNSPASTTPAIDAQHIYASWATGEGVFLAALDHNGKQQWRAKLPPFVGNHGFSSSPAVIGELVCLNVDTSQGGFLVAYNGLDGREVWRVPRTNSDKETYSTPSTIVIDGRELVIAESKGGGLQAVDPASGKVVARLDDVFPSRTVSSPLVAGNVVFASCGSGNNGHLLVGAEFTASGASVAFTMDRNVPYVPTALAKDELLFLWHDQGIVTCLDSNTQDILWKKRVGGNYYGSPICIGDRLFNLSREGKVVVLAASRDYKLLGETDLGQPTEASPSVAGGRLLLRTESKLHCLAESQ